MCIVRDAQPGVGLNMLAVREDHAGRGRLSGASVSRPGAADDMSQVSKAVAPEQQVLRLLRSSAGATCPPGQQGPRPARRAHATCHPGATAEASRPGLQARVGSDPAANA